MPGLTAVGTFSYNGYTADGTLKLKVASEPVRDEAERTVIYTRLVIDAEFIVAQPATDASGTNNSMEAIREALCHDGGKLVISNKGFGKPIIINGGGAAKDVNFGPKVEVLQWEPIGSRMACAVKWRCTTCIPCCPGNASYNGRAALNYSASFGINERGCTTRTIAGYIQIAMTRNGRRLPDCADLYRETFTQHAPAGFKRTQNYTVDKSKLRLDFTITDTEIASPNPFPPGVISATGTIRTSKSISGGRDRLIPRTTMSVTFERDKNRSGAEMYLLFASMVVQRIQAARAATGCFTLIESISAEEEIFGYGSTFNVTFKTLSALADLLSAGGLWVPIGTDWGTWRSSLQGSMFNQRGTAGLTVGAGEDAIVDLCGNQNFPVGQEQSGLTITGFYQGPSLFNELPPPNQSYLQFEMWLQPKIEQPFARLKPLQAPQDQQQGQGNQLQLNGVMNGQSTSIGKDEAIPDTIQKSKGRSYESVLKGRARRAGYEIPIPQLKQIGKQTAIQTWAVHQQRIVGDMMGIPIYEAFWNLEYQLTNSPGKVSPAETIE